ncbi:hypothetical protein [Kordiimonas aestuarii]|uniref:hypothetical protein n=1 Tax=Kordiimonas aestuarii TaxID=1005925 RepID=UPI0021D03BB9|nr:hypothetical protein [Kordiimonas aestuarii]
MSDIISIILVLTALVATTGMLWNRIKLDKGIGDSINQFAVATVALPLVAALAIMGVISVEVTGTLLGAGIGFIANGRQSPTAQK